MHSCIKEKPWKTIEKPKFFEGFRKSYFFIMFLHIFFRDACFSPKNASKIMISEATWLPCGVKVAPSEPMGGHGGHPGAEFNVLGEALAALEGHLGRYLHLVGWHLSLRLWISRILELPSPISDEFLIDFQWKNLKQLRFFNACSKSFFSTNPVHLILQGPGFSLKKLPKI